LSTEPIDLTIGEEIDLPRDIALILWPGCAQCDGFPEGLRRVYRDAAGSLRSEALAGPVGSGAPFEGNFVNFASSEDGQHIAMSVCLQGGCGGLTYPTENARTAIYLSDDSAVSWHRLATLDGGAAVSAVLPGAVIVGRHGPPYTVVSYPGGNSIVVPNGVADGPSYQSNVGGGLLWLEQGGHALIDTSGQAVVRVGGIEKVYQFLPSFATTQGSGAYTFGHGGFVAGRLYLHIGRGDGTTAALQFDGYIGLGGWLDSQQLIANIFRIRDGTFSFHTGIIDVRTHVFHPFKDILAAKQVEYLQAVIHGPFARVVTPGDCLNVRAEASVASESVACAADGVLLTDLRVTRSADGKAWAEVETPDGKTGWVDDRFIEH